MQEVSQRDLELGLVGFLKLDKKAKKSKTGICMNQLEYACAYQGPRDLGEIFPI